METRFSAGDICKILKTAGEVGVDSITLEGVNIKFQTALTLNERLILNASRPPETRNSVHELAPDQIGVAPLTDYEKELDEEAEHSQMMIDDPAEFEKVMSDNLLRMNQRGEDPKHTRVKSAL